MSEKEEKMELFLQRLEDIARSTKEAADLMNEAALNMTETLNRLTDISALGRIADVLEDLDGRWDNYEQFMAWFMSPECDLDVESRSNVVSFFSSGAKLFQKIQNLA